MPPIGTHTFYPPTAGSSDQPLGSPRFGWQSAGHTAIRDGATEQVDDNAWQRYLKKNQADIAYHDAAQDLQHKGPWHFVNLEFFNNTTKPQPLSWPELFQQWSPQRLKQVMADWQAAPLGEADLPDGPTVYDAVIESFNSSLRALSTVHDKGNTNAEDAIHSAATASLGALDHYVSDLHMPLHTTGAFTWGICPPWQQGDGGLPPVLTEGIHQFIEGDLFTATELTNLSLHAQQQPVAELTMATLKPYLRQQLMTSYLTNFKIFQAQVEVLARMVNPLAQPINYRQALKDALKPIIAERIMTSQRSLAAIHNLLWQEAKGLEHQRKAA